MSTDVIAHHEAGHAVAATVLGIPYLEVRIVPDAYGKTGVSFTVMPWTWPRPAEKFSDFTDQEWEEVLRDDAKWEVWQKDDNDKYAVFMLAGKAAQFEYAGTAEDEDAKFDYSFVQTVLPRCYARLGELETTARALVKSLWLAVLVVAAELLQRSRLTPAEVEEIIRRTMPEVQIPKSSKEKIA